MLLTTDEPEDIINLLKEKSVFMLLIISQNKKMARGISEAFHYMSILSYGTTPHEALSEISGIYRAVLIINPSAFPDINDYVARIKTYKGDIPVFAITDSAAPTVYSDIFDVVFDNAQFTPALAQKIIDFANKNNLARIGDYYLGGFDACSNTLGVHYFHTPLSLTKTEAMILRYLIRSYSVPQKADNILKYAFKPSRSPEATSIRTHLSLMNKKLEQCIGRRMISLEPNKGYVILTPEYIKNRAL